MCVPSVFVQQKLWLANFCMLIFHNLLPKFFNSSGDNRNNWFVERTQEHIFIYFWSSSTGAACQLHSPSITKPSLLCLHFKSDGWSLEPSLQADRKRTSWSMADQSLVRMLSGAPLAEVCAQWPSLIGWSVLALCFPPQIQYKVHIAKKNKQWIHDTIKANTNHTHTNIQT